MAIDDSQFFEYAGDEAEMVVLDLAPPPAPLLCRHSLDQIRHLLLHGFCEPVAKSIQH